MSARAGSADPDRADADPRAAVPPPPHAVGDQGVALIDGPPGLSGYPGEMFKVIGILKRPEGTSFDEFRQWWLDTHAPKVRRWPGLVAYNLNFAVDPDNEFDGVAEVWFDSEASARAVFDTPEGAAARESATGGSGRSVIFVAEETVIVDGPGNGR